MDIEANDDWNPDPNSKDSILNFQQINFSDKIIKQQKKALENLPFDASHIRKFAEENWIDDEEDEELNAENQQDFDFQKTKQQLMNEQMFYDPLEDYLNERYISNKYEKQKKGETNQVLSCSKCFTQVTYHSQQHETYKKQFRALITINTKIDENTIVKENNDEIYFQVKCKICDEPIGVFEVQQKIYHFYNVIQGSG